MFDKKLTTDERIDALAELMVNKFDEIRSELKNDIHKLDERLERVEFNTSGLERRTSVLEDKMRIISTKLGLA
jgi:hypothetical protein